MYFSTCFHLKKSNPRKRTVLKCMINAPDVWTKCSMHVWEILSALRSDQDLEKNTARIYNCHLHCPRLRERLPSICSLGLGWSDKFLFSLHDWCPIKRGKSDGRNNPSDVKPGKWTGSDFRMSASEWKETTWEFNTQILLSEELICTLKVQDRGFLRLR